MEDLVDVVHGISLSKSLVVVIPAALQRKLDLGRGDRFSVSLDDRNRIIYEAIGEV